MIAKNKRLMLVLVTVLIILTSTTTVLARWSNISDVTVVLSITNGKAVLTGSVTGYSGTTKITGVSVLERLNSDGTYTEIERWDNISADNWFLDWSATRYVATGYTYRFTFIPTVYRNGVCETVSGSKSAGA